MIGKKGDKMNKFASVTIFAIALAVVLALGIPGKANAFVNDDGTNGRLILAGGFDISIGGEGVDVDINQYKSEREQEYERQRAHERERAYDQDRALDRESDQRREYNREREERTYGED
jgi:hypothetical protein